MLVRSDRGTQGLVIGVGTFWLTDLNVGALLSGRSQCWCTLIGGHRLVIWRCWCGGFHEDCVVVGVVRHESDSSPKAECLSCGSVQK